jgi:uncharacterized protein
VTDLASSFNKPFSDDDYDALGDRLEAHSPFDIYGVLGLVHAVALAPSLMPPSAWLPEVLPNGPGEDAQALVSLLLRLYNEVLDALNDGHAILPEEDDVTACEAFAAGYAVGAARDPAWIGDDDRWTFAAPFAHLAGRLDLVPAPMLAKLEAMDDPKLLTRQNLGAIVKSTHESFRKLRQAALPKAPPPARVSAARVGRNEPCPCGSGKKYKKCCIDRSIAPPLP